MVGSGMVVVVMVGELVRPPTRPPAARSASDPLHNPTVSKALLVSLLPRKVSEKSTLTFFLSPFSP